MKRFVMIPAALVIGMAPIVAGHAQNTPPAPAVTAPSTTPVEMKIRLNPGEVRSYTITIDQDGTISMPGAGEGMPVKAGLTSSAKLLVDKQNDDGSYAVRYKVGGMKLTVNGTPAPMPGSDNLELSGTLSKDGVFTPSAAAKPSAAVGMGMDASQMLVNVLANIMSVPSKAIRTGETWTTSVPIPMDPTGSSVISVTNKVIALENVKGENVARIERTMNGPLNLSLTQPMPITIKGTMKGSGTSRISLASGQALDDNGTTNLNADITMDNPAGNGEKMTMKMSMVVKSRVESAVTPAVSAAPAAAAKP